MLFINYEPWIAGENKTEIIAAFDQATRNQIKNVCSN